MNPQGCCVRRRQVLVSYRPARSRVRRPPIILVPIVTVYCERRLEWPSTSGNHKYLKIALGKVPTRHPSRKDWERPWLTGTLLSSSTRNLRINVKGIWKLSRNRTICSLAWPSAQFKVVNLIISRRYALRHPRNMITLESIIIAVILIPTSLVTVSDTK